MIVDFRTSGAHESLSIKDSVIERVHTYKYLGVIMDDKLNFEAHVSEVYKKANSRLFHLRQLYWLKIDVTILKLFYSSIVQAS